MKELSIEQKAKAYDEALEKARQLCAYPTTKPFISDLQDIFPELRESEDEKIRKNIISWLKNIESQTIPINEYNSALAWLEKQGKTSPILSNSSNIGKVEQKPAFEMKTPEESLGIDSDTYSKIVDECVYGEQKPAEDRYMEGYLNGINDASKTLKSDAWSEEDEEHLDSIIESYKDLIADYKACHDVDYIPYNSETVIRNVVDDVNFLNTFKDRVRPKQEWSEEEQQTIKDAASFILSCVNIVETKEEEERLEELAGKLQDLKPQSHWKPSKEQMDAIEGALNDWGFQRLYLNSLYEQLKKLRELS